MSRNRGKVGAAVLEQLLVHVRALTLKLLMRATMGARTPRGLQDRTCSLTSVLIKSLVSAGNTLSITSECLSLLFWAVFMFVPLAGALGGRVLVNHELLCL